jgi:hypothetical protein
MGFTPRRMHGPPERVSALVSEGVMGTSGSHDTSCEQSPIPLPLAASWSCVIARIFCDTATSKMSEGSCLVAYAMNGFAMEQGRQKSHAPWAHEYIMGRTGHGPGGDGHHHVSLADMSARASINGSSSAAAQRSKGSARQLVTRLWLSLGSERLARRRLSSHLS